MPFRVDVLRESCPPELFGDRPVAPLIQQGDGQSHIEVHRPDVQVGASVKPLLVDEQRRSQAADDHEVVHQIAQLRRDVQAGRAHQIDLFAAVSVRKRRLIRHGNSISATRSAAARRPLSPAPVGP